MGPSLSQRVAETAFAILAMYFSRIKGRSQIILTHSVTPCHLFTIIPSKIVFKMGKKPCFFCCVRIAAVLFSTLMTATLEKVKIAVLKDSHFRAIFDYARKLLRLFWRGYFFRKCCFSPTQ